MAYRKYILKVIFLRSPQVCLRYTVEKVKCRQEDIALLALSVSLFYFCRPSSLTVHISLSILCRVNIKYALIVGLLFLLPLSPFMIQRLKRQNSGMPLRELCLLIRHSPVFWKICFHASSIAQDPSFTRQTLFTVTMEKRHGKREGCDGAVLRIALLFNCLQG